MIIPGSTYTLEMTYNGSGNRNQTVGDSIFHCHFYPHFAAGMWAMWRSHDVFEIGNLRPQLLDARMLRQQRRRLLGELRPQRHALLGQPADQFGIGDVGPHYFPGKGDSLLKGYVRARGLESIIRFRAGPVLKLKCFA
jgi:hypothetical protein